MVNPFLCRVSPAGVPYFITSSTSYDQATITGIVPSDMCTLYWTLMGIRLRYSFSVNGIAINRDFEDTISFTPKNRMITPIEFYKSDYDKATATSYSLQLDFSTIYIDSGQLCGLNFVCSETDAAGAINFSTKQINGMASIGTEFSFFNNGGMIYLNYIPSIVTSVSINNFTVDLTFAH